MPAREGGNVNFVDTLAALTGQSAAAISEACAISPWLRTPDYVRGGQLIATHGLEQGADSINSLAKKIKVERKTSQGCLSYKYIQDKNVIYQITR